MADDPVDAEFIEALPVKSQSWKCHCPACRVMICDGNYCDACLGKCVPALRKIHSAQPLKPQDIADGIKSMARVVDAGGALLGAITGKPQPRRYRR
jgi:hypothetical protein